MSLLYTASNKNVKQQSILVYIPNYLYPTPSASGKKLVILLVPRRITNGKHLLLYIVPQKLKKVNQTFLYFNRYTMYLYYITQLSVLCYCNLITNFSCKKSQNHFVHLVSSSPFRPIPSTKSGRNITKKHQIPPISRPRHTRRQNIPLHCLEKIP